MTAPAFTNASAHGPVNVVARTLSWIRLGLSWLGTAFACLQEARLEAEMRRIRHCIRRTDDDDRPIIT